MDCDKCVDVYEFYDGYEEIWMMEPEEERLRVQYIVLGKIESHGIVICYIGDTKSITNIGNRTHSRAWIRPDMNITNIEAYGYAKVGYQSNKVSLEKYRHQYDYLIENEKELNVKHFVKDGSTISVYDGYWSVSFIYDNVKRYANQFAKAIKLKILIFEVVETFLADNYGV